MANPIQIVAKLYEMRDTARELLGENYARDMREYGDIIESFAKRSGLTVLQAAQQLVKDPSCPSDSVLFIVAAAVERIEPSTHTSPSRHSL